MSFTLISEMPVIFIRPIWHGPGTPPGAHPTNLKPPVRRLRIHNHDIVSTANRTVTATLRDGSERVIYAEGRFQLD